MDHVPNKNEYDVTSQLDFIVPLKQVGLITRSVLEAIWLFYRPRRTIIISSKKEGTVILSLAQFWDVGPIDFIDEETFFIPNFNLKMSDIKAQYGSNRGKEQREVGWWLQQLIKLGASTQIPNISENHVVWDGDLVPIRRWRLGEQILDAQGQQREIKFYIAILQGEARSEFNTTQYGQCMENLTGFKPLDPQGGGTFVAHHMIFNRQRTIELLELMRSHTKSLLPWPQLIMSYSQKFYRFSEYKTYATFMTRFYPSEFHYHEFSLFGKGGLRFRDANEIIDSILQACPLTDGGIEYAKMREFVYANWMKLSDAQDPPGYIQLDHVYGLDGIDLNLSTKSLSILNQQVNNPQLSQQVDQPIAKLKRHEAKGSALKLTPKTFTKKMFVPQGSLHRTKLAKSPVNLRGRAFPSTSSSSSDTCPSTSPRTQSMSPASALLSNLRAGVSQPSLPGRALIPRKAPIKRSPPSGHHPISRTVRIKRSWVSCK